MEGWWWGSGELTDFDGAGVILVEFHEAFSQAIDLIAVDCGRYGVSM